MTELGSRDVVALRRRLIRLRVLAAVLIVIQAVTLVVEAVHGTTVPSGTWEALAALVFGILLGSYVGGLRSLAVTGRIERGGDRESIVGSLVPVVNLFVPFFLLWRVQAEVSRSLRSTSMARLPESLLYPVLFVWWGLWVTTFVELFVGGDPRLLDMRVEALGMSATLACLLYTALLNANVVRSLGRANL